MSNLTKRSQDEIVAKISEVADTDWMGTKRGDLAGYLDFAHAKQFLKEDVTEEEWKKHEVKTPAQEIVDYMEFAWEKANNFRGLSAARSLDHMWAWLWLDGKDEFLQEYDNFEDYEFYGKPQLVAICELYGLDSKKWDDGVRRNTE